MINRLANALDALHRRPKIVLAAAVACALLAGVGLRGIRFDPSLTTFFPPESSAARTLAFLADASLAGKVAVSFGRDAQTPEDVLHDAVNRFATDAATLPGVRGILDSAGGAWQTEIGSFYELMPQWHDADALEALSPRLEPDAVRAALKRRFSQLARPEGMFMADMVRHDPLGLFDPHLEALGKNAGRLGYDVIPDGGRLMSRDGLHRLVLLDTEASAADVRASETLLRGIQDALDGLPQGVYADVVCAHAHSVANQATVKRDLSVAGTLSAILLAAVLFFVSRDMRMIVVALVPLFSVLVAFPLCAYLFGGLTFLACAFGSILAGLGVDYGIHVYRAGRRVRPLLRPLLAGMGTTFAVFAGFFVSRAEGWRQVGCFGAVAIAAAGVFAVCVLPVLARCFRSSTPGAYNVSNRRWSVRTSHTKPADSATNLHSPARAEQNVAFSPCRADTRDSRYRRFRSLRSLHRRLLTFISCGDCSATFSKPSFRILFALALIALACFGLSHLRLDNDFTRLNGAGKAVFDAEKRFQETWGESGGARAIVAWKVANVEEADDGCVFLFEDVAKELKDGTVAGFASIAPAPYERNFNLDTWKKFWTTDNRAKKLHETLRTESIAFGFTDDAFDPFLKMINTPVEDTSVERLGMLLSLVRERFVLPSKSGGAYIAVYVSDDTDTLARLESWLDSTTLVVYRGTDKLEITRVPPRKHTIIVSRTGMPNALAQAFGADAVRVVAVMAVLLLVSAWVSLRSLRSVVLATMPCVAAIGTLFGALGLTGMPVNIAHLLAGMLVLGVTFDYGVFLLCESRGHLTAQTRGDVRLCLLTTLAGSAPLLLARHPVIFSLGFALTLGIGAGYVAAAWVLFPPRTSGSAGLRPRKRGGRGRSPALPGFLFALLLLSGCVSVVPSGTPVTLSESQRASLAAFPNRTFQMEQSVVFTLQGRDFAGFGITRIEPSEKRFTSTCLTTQGMTVFELAGQGDQLDVCRTMPGMGDTETVGKMFAESIRNIYFDNLPNENATWILDDGCWMAITMLSDGGGVCHRFDCTDGRLAEKRRFTRDKKLAWTVAFSDYDETGPRKIDWDDRTMRWSYTLAIRVKTWHDEFYHEPHEQEDNKNVHEVRGKKPK